MDELLTLIPFGLEGQIYRSPMPFSPLFDPDRRILSEYQDAGIEVIVMLTENREVRDLTGLDLKSQYLGLGMDVIHAPIRDFSVPSQQDLQEPIRKTLAAARDGKTVVIHCHAGWGRTGLFAACLAKIVLNMSGEEAIGWLRKFIPRAVETQEQYRFVRDFQFVDD